jgi:hypothetical protein
VEGGGGGDSGANKFNSCIGNELGELFCIIASAPLPSDSILRFLAGRSVMVDFVKVIGVEVGWLSELLAGESELTQ